MVPFVDDGAPQAILYADAFYQPGETRHKGGHIPAEVAIRSGSRGSNGWALVFFRAYRRRGLLRPRLGPGELPGPGLFASRRAFIYVLEIIAQVLALVTMARRLPPRWLAFIDNVAGQWTLTKGYGRDESVNGVLVAFWSTAAL